MFTNFLKIALRNIYREKAYALINIAGLAIGVASCILIVLFISSELTYDRHYDKSDRIYRAGVEAVFGDSHIFSAYTSGAMKDAMIYEFGEVEEVCRLLHLTRPAVKLKDRSFVEEGYFYADSSFFRIFSVPLISGDPSTALARPGTVVISEETAAKYFGEEDPMGRVLRVNDRYDMEITGVSRNMPHNSHFRYNFLGSMETVRDQYEGYWNYWTSNNLYTYILLSDNTDPGLFEERLQELVYKYVAPEVERIMGIDIESFEAGGGIYKFFTEAVPEIHLNSKADNQMNTGGNISYIYFFSIIAIFILLIACINFMNMATARYANRAKEVGVRKVVGSSKSQLIQQFLTESVMISLISIIIAMTLVELLLPWFNTLTGKILVLSYLGNWYILPSILGFSIATGILAGSYPAFFLSSFKPVEVLKGKVNAGVKSNRFRKILVVFQFVITISLLSGTFLVSQQLEYWQSRTTGYDRAGLVVLHRANILGDQQDVFREELLKNEGIINASYCSSVPGYDFSGTSLHKYGAPPENLVQTLLMWADEHYFETLGMELAQGRYFSSEFAADDDAVVVNEALVRAMDLRDPVNENIVFPHQNLISPVIGVLKEVNFESLHRTIRPMTIAKLDHTAWLMAIRIENENVPATIAALEQTWTGFTGDAPFVYSFLEDDLMQLYTQEMRTGRIFAIFSLLAIFIACLGLLGMASFSAEKRTKEIGIRKAMGAPVASIYILLTKEIVFLVLLSTIFAWPASWMIMNRWLENFAYRIEPGILTFITSTVIALLIGLLTVSYQAQKAAMANPVDSLKHE